MNSQEVDVTDQTTSDLVRLKRLADKIVEPLSEGANPAKTLGEWRKELQDELWEVVNYVAVAKAQGR